MISYHDSEKYQAFSDEDFVRMLYRDILGRSGDAEGIYHHLERLKKGTTSRQELIKRFLKSKEYRAKSRSSIKRVFSKLRSMGSFSTMFAGVTARLAYRLILNRPIDCAALAQWKHSLHENPLYRIYLINSLFKSEEYNQLINNNPLNDFIMLNYLHSERCKLVKGLPKGNRIVDLGGSHPNNPKGALLGMGYPHKFGTLLIVDLPIGESLEQKRAKETYDVVQTESGEIRYLYRNMWDIANIGIQENSVDLFWMGQSVEHIEEEKFEELLKLIHAYLRPGGNYCFDTPNRRVTSIQCPNQLIHPDHKVEYCFEDLAKKIKNAGFEIVETLGIGLADETLRQNRFLPGYVIENASINQNPEHSYIFYFKAQKRG